MDINNILYHNYFNICKWLTPIECICFHRVPRLYYIPYNAKYISNRVYAFIQKHWGGVTNYIDHILKYTGGIVSGSGVLQALLNEKWDSDINIFCCTKLHNTANAFNIKGLKLNLTNPFTIKNPHNIKYNRATIYVNKCNIDIISFDMPENYTQKQKIHIIRDNIYKLFDANICKVLYRPIYGVSIYSLNDILYKHFNYSAHLAYGPRICNYKDRGFKISKSLNIHPGIPIADNIQLNNLNGKRKICIYNPNYINEALYLTLNNNMLLLLKYPKVIVSNYKCCSFLFGKHYNKTEWIFVNYINTVNNNIRILNTDNINVNSILPPYNCGDFDLISQTNGCFDINTEYITAISNVYPQLLFIGSLQAGYNPGLSIFIHITNNEIGSLLIDACNIFKYT